MKDTQHLIKQLKIDLTGRNFDELTAITRGVTVVPISGPIEELVEILRLEAVSFDFRMARTTTTGVQQNFSSFSRFDKESLWCKFADWLAKELLRNFSQYGQQGLLSEKLSFTDLALQHYPKSESATQYGISPHRDQKGFVNLVVVLLLQGPSAFHVCEDKSGKGAIEIQAEPGNLILMRGGGFGGEHKGRLEGGLPRPCHFIGKINELEGRLSFGMRQITGDAKEAAKLREMFVGQK